MTKSKINKLKTSMMLAISEEEELFWHLVADTFAHYDLSPEVTRSSMVRATTALGEAFVRLAAEQAGVDKDEI